MLTETWLSGDVTDDEILTDLPNFDVFRNDRKGARGGGVLIATSKLLSCSVVDITTDLEILWLLIRSTPLTLLLGVCYRPPQSSPDFPQKFNNILNHLILKHPNARVLIFGDFNYPDIDWQDQAALSGTSAEAKEFVNICLNFNLTQLVLEPTRVTNSSANILDLILTTHPESLSSLTYLREISDHKVIHSVFNFSHLPSQMQSKTISLYDKGNYEAINNELQGFLPDFEARLSSRSVEDNWTIFKNKIAELARKFIPTT